MGDAIEQARAATDDSLRLGWSGATRSDLAAERAKADAAVAWRDDRIAELEAALRPFAAFRLPGNQEDPRLNPDDGIFHEVGTRGKTYTLTAGDFRRARAVLDR